MTIKRAGAQQSPDCFGMAPQLLSEFVGQHVFIFGCACINHFVLSPPNREKPLANSNVGTRRGVVKDFFCRARLSKASRYAEMDLCNNANRLDFSVHFVHKSKKQMAKLSNWPLESGAYLSRARSLSTSIQIQKTYIQQKQLYTQIKILVNYFGCVTY